MNEYKPGVLVRCRMPSNPAAKKFYGTIHTIREAGKPMRDGKPTWYLDPPTITEEEHIIFRVRGEIAWVEAHLEIIPDFPEEDLVTTTRELEKTE